MHWFATWRSKGTQKGSQACQTHHWELGSSQDIFRGQVPITHGTLFVWKNFRCVLNYSTAKYRCWRLAKELYFQQTQPSATKTLWISEAFQCCLVVSSILFRSIRLTTWRSLSPSLPGNWDMMAIFIRSWALMFLPALTLLSLGWQIQQNSTITNNQVVFMFASEYLKKRQKTSQKVHNWRREVKTSWKYEILLSLTLSAAYELFHRLVTGSSVAMAIVNVLTFIEHGLNLKK